jgi:tyrosyl-tRNA synthetase
MGKTANGAVWLDPKKTPPYEFYQYWRNVGDKDVLKCIRMLTFLPLDEVDEMDKWEGAQLNRAKEILAFELTKMIHGEEEAQKAQDAARALFTSGDSTLTPSVEVDESALVDGVIDVNSLLVLAKMVPSKSEGRRAIEQGGVTLDGEKITNVRATVTKEQLSKGVLIKRGKKSFNKFILK